MGRDDMKKIRVAAYCRVSKGGTEPEHSLQAQIAYYTEMIRSDPNYQFVGVYAEIASGLNVTKRTQFQKLLWDCRKKKIDLIYNHLLNEKTVIQILLDCSDNGIINWSLFL